MGNVAVLQWSYGKRENMKKDAMQDWEAPQGGSFGALLTALFLSYGKICLVKLIFHRNVATIAAVRVSFEEVLVTLIENVQLGVGQGRILIKAPIQFPQTLQMRVSNKNDKF